MQIEELNLLLLEYATGNYSRRGKISDDRDEMDALVCGINMLGEELQDSTISKNYFISIFNAVNEMIIVLGKNGEIQNLNNATYRFLGYTKDKTISLELEDFLCDKSEPVFFQLKKELKTKDHYSFDTSFRSVNTGEIPVSCSCSKIMNKQRQTEFYLLVAKDISEQKETENQILRAIVETQESEQKRVAEDLHDSLGQQLSAIKLYLNSIKSSEEKNVKIPTESFTACSNILDDAITNLRLICFNLLPGSLEQCGLADSISQLVFMLNNQDRVKVHFQFDDTPVKLKKEAEISLYRIVQEFINNSLKHAEASNIRVLLTVDDYVMLQLSDDGKGFDPGKKNVFKGNGLNNMNSRIKAFKGQFKLTSIKGKGTRIYIKLPNHE